MCVDSMAFSSRKIHNELIVYICFFECAYAYASMWASFCWILKIMVTTWSLWFGKIKSARGSVKHRDGTLNTSKMFFFSYYFILFYVWRKNVQHKEHKRFIIKKKVHLIISSSGAFLSKPHFKVGVKRNDQLLVIFTISLEIFLWGLRTKKKCNFTSSIPVKVLKKKLQRKSKCVCGWF